MEENAVSRGYLQEEFRLFHNRDTLGAVTELHYHDFYKIMMLIEGDGSYTIQGRRYELRPGDVVLVDGVRARRGRTLPGCFPAGRGTSSGRRRTPVPTFSVWHVPVSVN